MLIKTFFLIFSSNLNYLLAEALKEFGKMIDTVEDERDRMVSHLL